MYTCTHTHIGIHTHTHTHTAALIATHCNQLILQYCHIGGEHGRLWHGDTATYCNTHWTHCNIGGEQGRWWHGDGGKTCFIWLFSCPAGTHCNTLQHTATHCNTLQHTATHCNTLQRTATHCNTLQHTATSEMAAKRALSDYRAALQVRITTHCYTLLDTATRCCALQHTATHCNTLQHIPAERAGRALSASSRMRKLSHELPHLPITNSTI